MITCPSVSKQLIRGHYDLSTPFYRLLWGPHIHHGLWEGSESPKAAQVRLTERLADLAQLGPGQTLIDVGCGMGGSSIHLAKSRKVRAIGITISPLQRWWAATSALLQSAARQTEFHCADAEQVDFAPSTADVVWSIECTEHLFDKPAFFRRGAEWLRSGGRMAVCAWLAAEPLSSAQRQQVYDVCEGFFCPSLGSTADYIKWMEDAGLAVRTVEDWTVRVARTWEICRDRVRRSGIRRLARLIDRGSATFLDRFDTLLDAYRSGAMTYGCFVAEKR